MSIGVQADPIILSLAKAVGLINADGQIDPVWFEDPLKQIRNMLADDTQRAALFALLDSVLPSSTNGNVQRYPLFDSTGRYNVYVTVDGDTVGLAAEIETSTTVSPTARAGLSLPLVRATGGNVVAVTGPLEVAFDVTRAATEQPSAIGVRIALEFDGKASLRIRLENIKLGEDADVVPVVELDPADLDAEGVQVVVALLLELLSDLSNDPILGKIADHLPGLLGFEPGFDPLPLQDLTSDPRAFATWLAAIASDSTNLKTWFEHLVGLLADPAIGPPTVTGGTNGEPLQAKVIDFGADASLNLTLTTAIDATSGVRQARFGVAIVVNASIACVEAAATIAAIALEGTASAAVLPNAHVLISTRPSQILVDHGPTIKIGRLRAGLAWNGNTVAPLAELFDVVVEGTPYKRLDLMDTRSVGQAASSGIQTALSNAIGTTGAGRSLQSLVGLMPPQTDTTSPHTLSLATLATNPTRAIADVHRWVLVDPQHSWSHLFAEIASLLGLPSSVLGTGTRRDPWRVAIAQEGIVALEFAGWNDRDIATQADTPLLRLGLRAVVDAAPWQVSWLAELLGFDLRPDTTAVHLLGGQHLVVSLAPLAPTQTVLNTTISASSLVALADWAPGLGLQWAVKITDLAIQGGGESVGPLTLTLPPPLTFDPSAPGLGLGIPSADLTTLLRLVLTDALASWGGMPALTLGALLGIHRRLGGFPLDWPLIAPPDPNDFGSLLSNPLEALRDYVARILTGVSGDGTPFVLAALPWLTALCTDTLPDRAEDIPPLALPVSGSGTYDDPWALPLAGGPMEALLWLEPEGPGETVAATTAARLRTASSGAALVELLSTTGELSKVGAGRDPQRTGSGLDRLADWFARSDGVVPAVAQVPTGTTWTSGTPVAGAHHSLPSHPAVIEQIRAQIDAWAGTGASRAVLLLGPPFAEHHAWDPFLAKVEPDRRPGAHFDLRAPGIDPLTVDLTDVDARATHYTADLDDCGVAPTDLLAQIDRVIDRINELTGQTVYLVGHSTGGAAARLYAAAHPTKVAGLITIGSPHDGSPLTPFVDTDMADALRLAKVIGLSSDSPAACAVEDLNAALDTSRNGRGDLYAPASFTATTGTVDVVQALAIEGRIGSGLLDAVIESAAERVTGNSAAPTHLGIGMRLRIDTPPAGSDELSVDLHVRVDVERVALDTNAAEPSRPRRRLHVLATVYRSGGWLVGEAGAVGVRLRRAELGAVLEPAETGGLLVTPLVRLHEVGAWGPTTTLIELADIGPHLSTLPRRLPLTEAPPSAGTAAAFLLDALTALGIVVQDGIGSALAVDVLAQLASQPLATLGPRLPALLDAVASPLGLTGPNGGPWALQLAEVPIELTIARNPWTLRVRTHHQTGNALGLAAGVSLGFDALLGLPGFAANGDVHLSLGATRLVWSGRDRTLSLGAPHWLSPTVLVPAPSPDQLRTTLAQVIPRLTISAALSTALQALTGSSTGILPLDLLFTNPREQLLRPEALGSSNGAGIDSSKVTSLLAIIAQATGLQTNGGLRLPSGLTLTATGVDPVTIALDGVLPIGTTGDEVRLALGARIDRTLAVSPVGTITFVAGLPGGWGATTIVFGADPTGLALSVTPSGASTIELLPRFSGFGALASTAVKLLPHALQLAVNALRPPTDPLLKEILDIASALGIYAEDAQGFEEPTRAAELERMLQADYLESKQASASAIVQAVTELFGLAPLVQLPVPWSLARVGDAAQLEYTLPSGGKVGVRLGWTTTAGVTKPALAMYTNKLTLGPVVMDEVSLGYDQAVVCKLLVSRSPGDPRDRLAFLSPALKLDAQAGRFVVAFFPLGRGTENDLAIELAPSVRIVKGPNGPVRLVETWGVPLVGNLLVRAFSPELGKALWPRGPTAREVLEQAGVIEGSNPPALKAQLPPLGTSVLRAGKALAKNVKLLDTEKLDIELVRDDTLGRNGIRIKGRHDITKAVSIRFGDTAWLDDEDAGVTLWLLKDTSSGTLPIEIEPSLQIVGFGALLSGENGGPLIEGAFTVGAVGAFTFFDVSFLDSNGSAWLKVTRFGAALEIDNAKIVLPSDDGDSFMKRILPLELKAPFRLALAWRHDGLRVYSKGGAGLELTFPLDIDLKLIQIDELYLALMAAQGSASLTAAVSGRADLGVIKGAVERVGLRAMFAAGGMQLRFKSPDMVGLAINAGPVTGGGFVYINEAKGQYAGGLVLKLQSLSLTAIGLINTRLPDGSPIIGPGGLPGFSLLVIIAVKLPAIQLGFGFTLSGIGGLLGYNRTIDIDALRAGVRTRALDAILFPPDPAENAAKVVATLSSVFPVALGRFVVGPMVSLAWGTPPILTFDLGVLIELPPPIRVVVLGRIRVMLPPLDEELAIILINLDVIGVIDFDRGEVSIDAALYDSKLAFFALTGQMALRARWKGTPEFALAVGGFHPAFVAPRGFPALERLAISLSSGDNPRLRLEAYFAVTSNSLQFGARVDLYVAFGDFKAEGMAAFDVLIQLTPVGLYFQADFEAAVAISWGDHVICSASLEAHLTGPQPLHIWGRATFSFLGCLKERPFDKSFGPEVKAPPLPPLPINVKEELCKALKEPANWSAQPPSGESVVSVRSPSDGEDIVVHPLGGLTFRQRLVPLKLTIEQFGSAQIEGPKRFEISAIRLGGGALGGGAAIQTGVVKDAFAPAQFLNLSNDEKLSRPSFEDYESGVSVVFDSFAHVDDLGAAEAAALAYDRPLVVDVTPGIDQPTPMARPAAVRMSSHDAVLSAHSGFAAFASARRSGERQFDPPLDAPRITVDLVARSFKVTNALDGLELGKGAAPTFAQAAELLASGRAEDGALRVVPEVTK